MPRRRSRSRPDNNHAASGTSTCKLSGNVGRSTVYFDCNDVADRRVWTEVVVEALIYHIVRLTMCGSARHVQHTVHASDAFLRYAAQRSYSVLQIHYTASHKILFSEVLSAACLATPFEVHQAITHRLRCCCGHDHRTERVYGASRSRGVHFNNTHQLLSCRQIENESEVGEVGSANQKLGRSGRQRLKSESVS